MSAQILPFIDQSAVEAALLGGLMLANNAIDRIADVHGTRP